MARVLFLQEDLHNDNYRKIRCSKKGDIYRIVNYDVAVCPHCYSPLKVRDSRKRQVKDSSGTEYIFQLRRLYCPICKQIHLEIPDSIEPQKHYFKSTIENTLSNKINYCTADNSTIRRWQK